MKSRLSREILCILAERYGILTEYFDVLGNRITVPEPILLKILKAFGISIKNNIDVLNETKKFDQKIFLSRIEPVTIVWDKDDLTIKIYITEPESTQNIQLQLILENGALIKKKIELISLPNTDSIICNKRKYFQKSLKVVDKLDYGYHHLSICLSSNQYHCFIISAPSTAYHDDVALGKRFGVFAPIYALRSKRNAGAGDLTDFRDLITWLAEHGGGFIGTLPIHATSLDEYLFEPSPYSPISRLFWNEFYLDVKRVCKDKEQLVDYQKVMRFKRTILQNRCEDAENPDDMIDFKYYLDNHPEINIYASFRTKMETSNLQWANWSEEDNNEVIKGTNSHLINYQYHRFVQWQMDRHLDELKQHADNKDVMLYFDMPISVSRQSFDAWRFKDHFALDINIGAPPDVIFSKGQNWNLPPLHPIHIRETHYSYLRKALAVIMHKVHLLRIDHIMGFHRLFWIPEGEEAKDGTYVKYPADEIYAILCLESHRHKVTLVGENLGTVPSYVNQYLDRFNLYKMHVVEYELESANPVNFVNIPTHSVVSLNTHDMPTFAAYYQGLDILTRHKLGLVPSDELEKEKLKRRSILNDLRNSLTYYSLLPSTNVFTEMSNLLSAVLLQLALSQANLLLINIEDLWLEVEPQNMPSTDSRLHNWRRKMQVSIESLNTNTSILNTLRKISSIRPKSNNVDHFSYSSFSLINNEDIYLFNEGTHYRLYEKLGAHIINQDGRNGAYFSVWAPNAKSVTVIGNFNHWNKAANPLRSVASSGIWEGFIDGVRSGDMYKYFIQSNYADYQVEKADAFGYYHEVSPKTASLVWDMSYTWHDLAWLNKRKQRQNVGSPISIYELHIGSWQSNVEDTNSFLTYRELAPLLTEYIKKTGYTHVEFLPIMEHPFYGSWGYQISGYFAPTSRYGTPQDLMYCIDYLHQHDIGVILDWVPSHFPHDEHGLAFFDGTHLFEHEDQRLGFHPDWKSAIFNYGRHEVNAFLISNAQFWLDKYHIDGLRVDGVASMLYLDYSRNEHEWVPNKFGGSENLDAIKFLKKLNETIYMNYPDVQMIAEESTTWAGVTRPTALGGLGFDYKWDMGWMHDTLRYFSRDYNSRRYHQNDLNFRMVYAFSEKFILPLSHDEVVHGKGSLLNKMTGSDIEKFANLRLLLGIMFAQPGKKLLFMGNDFGQINEWSHDHSLDWQLLNIKAHQQIQAWVSRLNKIYRLEKALHQLDCYPEGLEWMDCHDPNHSVISFVRKASDEYILVVFNTLPVLWSHYRIGVPHAGAWMLIANSDDVDFGGTGMTQTLVTSEQFSFHNRADSITIDIAPLSILFFKYIK